ncbi:MAG TPA: LUD domain-containing protein [Miltoncostaeaceae bacterium]|nr:LUD domain-containing protein [Miltoncostaeaceae bacterium]
MATDAVALADGILAALARRRATGERVTADGAGAAAVARAREWGVERALLADDPVLAELGVGGALGGDGRELLGWPDGRGRGWRELLGLEGPEVTMGVTVPALGVAERGTLVLEAGPGHGRSIDVVSTYHLAVLPASRLRATLAEALIETYGGGRRPPTAVSLVSAPSRTSDIEKISTLGAHGAKGLHVLVVEDR